MSEKNKEMEVVRSDQDIATDVRRALRLDNDVPDEGIMISVGRGSVQLDGTVELTVQRETAEADARRVRGVAEVVNRIQVEPSAAGMTV